MQLYKNFLIDSGLNIICDQLIRRFLYFSLKPYCPDDEMHYIAPLPILNSLQESKVRLTKVLTNMPRTNIVKNESRYIYVEFRTGIMLYTDDVEFLFDETQGLIHFRSASRLGYSDLGLNRRRMERIRTEYLSR